MKLVPALIMLYMILISIIIFDNISNNSSYGMELYNQSSYNINDNSMYNSFWSMFMNPAQLANNAIWIIIGSAFAAGAGIVLSYATKSDLFLLLSVFILIFGAGMVPLVALYGVVNREIWVLFYQTGSCPILSSTNTCSPSLLLSAILVGPLVLSWFWSCMEWWTARNAS